MSPARSIAEPPRALADSVALADFLAAAEPLELSARYQLAAQARVLLEGLYVHLPLKRAMHAVDPIQRLRLLERRLESLSDLQFHAELAAVFRSLRDLHTVYQLPDPYRGHVATLGFLLERYVDDDGPHYLVTKVDAAVRHAGFDTGAEVVTWNGVPIARAVERNAELQAGSNLDARAARGLEALTLRSLRTSAPPDEHWVLLEYRTAAGRRRMTRIPWRVRAAETRAGRAQDPVSTIVAVLGIDAGSEATRQVKRQLFAPPRASRAEARALRSVLDYGRRRLHGRAVGYVRIFSFNVASARRFVEQLAAILARLPQDRLIIDIRGNPGGNVPAAEGALQLIAKDRRLEPVRFSLATTPAALALCQSSPSFAAWRGSIRDALETGELYSQPFPLVDPEALAGDLPRYPGEAVLITDALSYSAADIFAAGFQDNELGGIVGTAQRTGAGGANVWTHELLRMWLSDDLETLPRGAGFRVALRRATRVGANVGVPLEDLGVEADEVHQLTRRDITGHNEDLLLRAAELLG